jgi:hypothetical protein
MTSAEVAPYLYADFVKYYSASGVITPGDFLIASGSVVISDLTSAQYRYSGVGVALARNPRYDNMGVAHQNPRLPVGDNIVFRVSAGDSGTAGDIPVGSFATMTTTGSGIVGQTGATGVGAIWTTAAPAVISTAAGATGKFAAVPFGVAQVVSHVKGGDATAGQVDLRINLATNIA